MIPSKVKEPLEEDKMDELIIDGIIRPENIIENTEKFNIKSIPVIREPYEIDYMEDVIIITPKKEKILKKESMDKLSIDGEIKPQNTIEKTKQIDILSNPSPRPKNEIKNIDKIFIAPKEKSPLTQEKLEDFNIKGVEKILPKQNNVIKNIDKIYIASKIREPLLEDKRDELHIEGTKTLKSAKKILSPLKKENIDELCYEGEEEPKEEEKKPIKINEISNIDKKFIEPKEREPLLKEKKDNICIEGIKQPVKVLKSDNIIENVEPIYIPSIKKEPLQKQFNQELFIENTKITKEPENNINEIEKNSELEIPKDSGRTFKNNTKDNNDQFYIEGIKDNKKPIEDNVEENTENIFISGIPKPDNEVVKTKIPNEICKPSEDLCFEGQENPEIIILRNKYKKVKEEIKPNLENEIYIPGNDKSESVLISQYKILRKYESEPIIGENKHFSIISKEKKPFLVENKGCFNIISKKIENPEEVSHNLLVQGSSFGLLAKPNEPGQKTQDIENQYLLYLNKWNKNNYPQRTYKLNVKGNNKPNLDDLIIQKVYNFGLDRDRNIVPPNQSKVITKPKDEIIQDDYNYISLEKDDKQRRTVKASITRVYRENEEDDSGDIDPLSGLSKHKTNKYDKIFNKINERKTSSVKNNNDGDGGNRKTVIVTMTKGKICGYPFEDMKKSDSAQNERKTTTILINQKNDKKINSAKFKERGVSKSQGLFKSKEKKTEYLRDYDNEPQLYS